MRKNAHITFVQKLCETNMYTFVPLYINCDVQNNHIHNIHIRAHTSLIMCVCQIVLENCRVTNATSDGDGGALLISNSSLLVVDSHFEENSARKGDRRPAARASCLLRAPHLPPPSSAADGGEGEGAQARGGDVPGRAQARGAGVGRGHLLGLRDIVSESAERREQQCATRDYFDPVCVCARPRCAIFPADAGLRV